MGVVKFPKGWRLIHGYLLKYIAKEEPKHDTRDTYHLSRSPQNLVTTWILVADTSTLTTEWLQMSMLQKMHFESGLLKVDASGEFSLEEAERAFLEMLRAVAQYQAQKVLFDGRNVTGKPGAFTRFCYGEFAAKETRRLVAENRIAPRFAYVINEPLRDPERFGETVAINRGMTVKTFETPKQALEWLELTPPNKPGASDA